MTCRELIDSLLEYLEGDATPEERAEFDKHLAICPQCVEYLRTYRETVRLGQAAMSGEEPPPEVPDGILQALLEAFRSQPPAGNNLG